MTSLDWLKYVDGDVPSVLVVLLVLGMWVLFRNQLSELRARLDQNEQEIRELWLKVEGYRRLLQRWRVYAKSWEQWYRLSTPMILAAREALDGRDQIFPPTPDPPKFETLEEMEATE